MSKTIITEERVRHMVETDPQQRKLGMIPSVFEGLGLNSGSGSSMMFSSYLLAEYFDCNSKEKSEVYSR